MNKHTSSSLDITQKRSTAWLLFIGIILIGATLRAPLTSVGSLISFIRDDLELSSTLAGAITTLPLLAFAILSPFAPKMANRIGMEWTIFISLILLSGGIIIRSAFGMASLFAGTIIIGIAISIGNVLLPGLIKANYPLKIGIMTGVYAVFMNIFGALASGLSVPISSINGFGWKGSLAFWGIISFIALAVWIPQLISHKQQHSTQTVQDPSDAGSSSIWKSSLAWSITLFMGLQSLIFYTLITWLPVILQSNGYTSNAAGWMLFSMQFAIIPVTFVIPVIAEKMKNQIILAVTTAALFIIGISGLLTGSSHIVLLISVILIGIAGGSAFSLSMMFFSLRTTNGKQAAEMSGMAQSFGYLLAAVGPVLFGALHDITNSWKIPLIMLVIASIAILITGIRSGKNEMISDKPIENPAALSAG